MMNTLKIARAYFRYAVTTLCTVGFIFIPRRMK